ncbi:immune inhibitor A domain-containing protein [Chengkuizengella axinellae]|uniref:Immune inhibitor A n=1 Tax=Chengkuizengella axinellae TaxID=3064388 RepID=A0ABT9J4B0_9BACL|nr:immune inhibitor A domain-containing protein [Chengkuizengella sp. 2205SS18-9]MDP5276443.1 immune inhibitor A [Chengkuizengella sp. 2205SS18-9]
MNKKIISTISTVLLSVSLIVPSFSPGQAEAQNENYNIERYGDVLDIGPKLRDLSQDEEYLKLADEKLREQAASFSTNDESESSEEDNFTFNGGTKPFLVIDENSQLFLKDFTLRSVGEGVEIWVADDLSFPEGDDRPPHVVTQEQVDQLREEFDGNIYPKVTDFFGDPDLLTGENSFLTEILGLPEDYYVSEEGKDIILVDNIIDENYYDPTYPFFTGGFFFSTFEDYINRNIITIDTLDWENRLEQFFGTTAHEYQHLIHSDKDGDEVQFINEGMSDFAEFIAGYGHPMGHVNAFLDKPENSLVAWDEYAASGAPESTADYGQAYLLQLYLSEQYGKEFIQALAADQANGIESINNQLEAFDAGIDFGELFKNFSTALAIDSGKPGNGIYEFESIDLKINFESAAQFEKDGVPAWGGNYKVIELDDKIRTITFDGIDFLPVNWLSVADPLGSDNEVLWGNEGHEIDNSIIFKADLTDVSEATLSFDNFIDIEEQWDYGVVQVSTDEGETWISLGNENTRSDISDPPYPKILENLPGFTGHYEGWQNETFDLSEYAGQEVWVSFRYLTDWGFNDTGWFIDNISIPEIGFNNDGSSLDDFYSIGELKEEYVDYAVTFINERNVGKDGKNTKYKVIDVDPFNITDEDALELRQLFKDGTNYMIIWYAPEGDDRGVVDFTYEILTKSDEKIKK